MSRKPDLVASIKADMKQPEAPSGSAHAGGGGSRDGMRFVGGYFSPEVARQVKILAAEEGTTVQALTGEALNFLFAAYGKPQIVPGRER